MAKRQAHADLRGVLRFDAPLARHTAWGIGGPAERVFEPADAEDLAVFMSTLPADEPVFWMGLGSNVLVRDGGIAGTVILTGRGLGGLEMRGEHRVHAGAGVACPKVAKYCAARKLGGAEFFAGIPGTVGGALAMNAGAFGGETWEIVASVQTVSRTGRLRVRAASDFEVSYRTVVGPGDEWFVSADLELEADAHGKSGARIRELLALRAATQPVGTRNCGSVFRNPPGDFAARLIEASGLKGERIGGAMVSDKHANFIINVGDAAASDVEALMALIVERVESEHGVRLIPEVRVVGESSEGDDAP